MNARHQATATPSSRSSDALLAIVREACGREPAATADWDIDASPATDAPWIRVEHAGARTPEQGWKLHVSATVRSAEEVLRRALAVLLADNASFKLASSLRQLTSLNEGEGTLSQVGKFITVYPNDDAQAVRLAVALDQATRGLSGPAVPSDRPLAPGSLVHYRFGGFGGRQMQTPLGEVLPALHGPDGELVPDRRPTSYQPPAWAVDPFIAAGVAAELPPASPLIAGRYLPVSTLHDSPRGAVYLAADLEGRRRCVLKRAVRYGSEDAFGRDAIDRLRYEAEVLERLAPDERLPRVYALVEHDGDLFLVMEDVEGETFEQHLAALVADCRVPSDRQVVAWGRELAALLGALHERGFVYRDLKSNNVIVAPDGRLRLIDFELAQALDDEREPYGRGTRGYMSPQAQNGDRPTIADDVYSLGALLYCAASGTESSLAPRPFALLERPIRLMNPAVGPNLEWVIARCLDPDPAGRFPSMAALDAALAGIDAPAAPLPPLGGEGLIEPEPAARRHSRDLARRLGDTLVAVARRAGETEGRFWLSMHEVEGGMLARDLGAGSAGPVLALAELVAEFGEPAHRDALVEGARWLAQAPPPDGFRAPGLYVGEAGVGAALLRAGQVLGDRGLIAEAEARGRLIASLPYASPDLYNGTAGRLRFHLWLWDETAKPEHLRHAREAGEALLATAEATDDGGLRWTIPPGYDGLSGDAYVGYAHGVAGIADTLLDLFDATADERYLAAAAAAGRWLANRAIPVFPDGSGLDWASVDGDTAPAGGLWCHGAAGVGRFFLHAAALGALPRAADLAARAARTVARSTRRFGPTQCHGLVGSIEFLLDTFQATGAQAYLAEARALARILEAFATEQHGRLVWPSESPETITPDYMVGYAGVAVCLLRLADPVGRPHQLSRAGFAPSAAEEAA